MDLTPVTTKYFTKLELLLAIALISSVVVVAYYPSLDYFFVWDDFSYLLGNPYITDISWKNIQWMFTTLYMSNWHPLVWLSFALDYSWQGGLNPWGYHLTNIILHNLNSIGVFLLTILLLNITEHGVQAAIFRPLDRSNFFAALIAALLFAIHPQHIESVAWISERKDVLCLLFILPSIFFYLFYSKQAATKWYWYSLSLIFFILAIMSKPLAVTLPVVLFLLDIYPLRRTSLLKPSSTLSLVFSWNHLFKEKIIFFIPTIFSIILTLLAQKQAMAALEKFDLPNRIVNAIHSIFLYISKFLFPIALSPLYPFSNYFSAYQINLPKIITLIIGFILLTVLLYYFWRQKKPYFLIAWLFYLVTLSPMIGIIQVGGQSAADRYTYLTTIPFCILIGTGLAYIYYRPYSRLASVAKLTTFSGIVLVGTLLFKIHQDYLPIWKNNFTLWSHAIRFNPINYIAQHNLAVEYFLQYQAYKKALEHIQLAVYSGAPWQREELFIAEIFLVLERFDEALQTYHRVLAVDPNARKDCIYHKIGWINAKQGSYEKALLALAKVSAHSPEFAYAQVLATRVALLDPEPTLKNPVFERLNLLTILFDQRELKLAKLDQLLAQKNYYFCFNAAEFNP